MFYDIKNQTNGDRDLYVYGDIVSEKSADWWTGEVSENDTDLVEFRSAIEDMASGQTLRMYINSGGGSVFAASAMVSMIYRARNRGVRVESYIDGLAGSAASWLALAADKCHTYRNSMMMVHKPLTFAYGNADELRRQIVALDAVETGVMMPIYANKAKVSEAEIAGLVAAESWLTSDEINNIFEVDFSDEEKPIAACTSEFFANYKNIPEHLKNKNHQKQVDYTQYESILQEVKQNA